MAAGDLLTAFWAAWAVSWIAAARWSAPVAARPPRDSVFAYRALIVLGVALLLAPRWRWGRVVQLWQPGGDTATLLACLTLPGFAFAWWARLHLGSLWSGSVTRKADHRVVDSGPYAVVRHPIYTGLIAAILASAIAAGTLASLVGAAFVTAGFYFKARLEERFLVGQLPGYPAYRRRVPMLLPFAPHA